MSFRAIAQTSAAFVLRQRCSISGRTLIHSRARFSSEQPIIRRNLSSDSASVTTKPNESSVDSAVSNVDAAVSSIANVSRHGPGDGIICLDVGGKHFYTLRSTIASNPVLSDIVARAEANQELTSSGHAIFVDRDPKHFRTILTYLRNQSEGLTYTKKSSLKQKKQHVQLPNDSTELADLYIEAKFFQIEPLQDALCHHSIFTLMASVFSGGSNPFSTVTEVVKTARRVGLALVAGGSIAGGSAGGSFGDIKLPAFLKQDKDECEKVEKKDAPAKDPEPVVS